jgi:GNAT superfamily N-acetyltransferase
VLVNDARIPSLRAVWVHPKHRRRGIATRLLHEGARFQGISVESLGLVLPYSAEGLAFARRYLPQRLEAADPEKLRRHVQMNTRFSRPGA